jgi:AhpD family alkylhydroperoxidase
MFLLEEVERLYDRFADAAYKPNILDGKTKELIALSNSVMADCIPCINHHYQAAIKYGASKEEIAEALVNLHNRGASRVNWAHDNAIPSSHPTSECVLCRYRPARRGI